MSKNFAIVFVTLLVCAISAFAQDNQSTTNNQTTEIEVPRFEVGAQFSSLNTNFNNKNGFGGRFTANFNRYLAAEVEGNFFPGRRFAGGNGVQLLAGVKAGKRWNKFGVFGKARPGFIHSSAGRFEVQGTPQNPVFITRGRTDFAADVGGVLEFYPTRRIVTRFDFGDTITRINPYNSSYFDQNGNVQTFRTRASTRHNFQFSAGIGFRF